MTDVQAMTPVESSNIEALGYQAPTQTMTVKFKTGAVYHYQNVLPDTYQAILTAESVGSAFNKLVKAHPSVYPFTKVA